MLTLLRLGHLPIVLIRDDIRRFVYYDHSFCCRHGCLCERFTLVACRLFGSTTITAVGRALGHIKLILVCCCSLLLLLLLRDCCWWSRLLAVWIVLKFDHGHMLMVRLLFTTSLFLMPSSRFRSICGGSLSARGERAVLLSQLLLLLQALAKQARRLSRVANRSRK